MDRQFDVLFVVDDDNHLIKIVHGRSIAAEDWQADSEAGYKQIILATENRSAIVLLLPVNDPTARQSRVIHRAMQADLKLSCSTPSNVRKSSKDVGPRMTVRSKRK